MLLIYETVKEYREHNDFGKEDIVKETQEGCLSRPIKQKSKLFDEVSIFLQLVKKLF